MRVVKYRLEPFFKWQWQMVDQEQDLVIAAITENQDKTVMQFTCKMDETGAEQHFETLQATVTWATREWRKAHA